MRAETIAEALGGRKAAESGLTSDKTARRDRELHLDGLAFFSRWYPEPTPLGEIVRLLARRFVRELLSSAPADRRRQTGLDRPCGRAMGTEE